MEGMNYQAFWKFIKLLHDNNLLEHVIVIGSWCEYIYAQSGILPDYSTMLRTLDIDFLIKNMRKPSEKVNLSTIAQQNGYTVDYDVMNETTKIYTPDLMEIEFLIEQKGAGIEPVIKTNLGVNAQALHHVGMLKQHTITVSLFDMDITVPIPEAYAVHKVIINESRGKKSEKDMNAVQNILSYLDRDKLKDVIDTLTKKERAVATQFFNI